MNEISTWVQGNWYNLGNLLSQFAFLLAALWFARKILKAVRSTQEQFGTLLKLSMTDGLKPTTTVHRSAPYVMAEWPTASEAPTLSIPEPEPRSKRLANAYRGVIRWLQTPMGSGQAAHWRRVLHWLQSPAGS